MNSSLDCAFMYTKLSNHIKNRLVFALGNQRVICLLFRIGDFSHRYGIEAFVLMFLADSQKPHELEGEEKSSTEEHGPGDDDCGSDDVPEEELERQLRPVVENPHILVDNGRCEHPPKASPEMDGDGVYRIVHSQFQHEGAPHQEYGGGEDPHDDSDPVLDGVTGRTHGDHASEDGVDAGENAEFAAVENVVQRQN